MSRHDPDCLFCRIAGGQIPATVIYRNEHILAFRDINPAAPIHALIIPVEHIAALNALDSDDEVIAGQILLAAKIVAEKTGVFESGYRLVFNNGPDALQSVGHLHAHLIGGKMMGWPPFPGHGVAHGES